MTTEAIVKQSAVPIGMGDIVEFVHRRDGIVVTGQVIGKMRDRITVYLTTPDRYAGDYVYRVTTSVKRVGVGYYRYHGKRYTRNHGYLYTFVNGFPTRADAVAYIDGVDEQHDAYIVLPGVPDDAEPIPNICPGYSVWREPYVRKDLARRRRR